MATHEDFRRSYAVKTSTNRSFGWIFTGVFVIVGLWPLLEGTTPRRWALLTAAAIALITLAAPVLLSLPNRLWLRFGLLLHRLVSPVVLGFLFYIVVTPTGLLMRLFRKDSLRLRGGGTNVSHWISRDPPGPKPDSLRNQF